MKVNVPEGMLKAVREISYSEEFCRTERLRQDPIDGDNRSILEAALQWQSENARRPTKKNIEEIFDRVTDAGIAHNIGNYCVDWVRIMYAEPEPPQEIADLLDIIRSSQLPFEMLCKIDAIAQECYQRGKASK